MHILWWILIGVIAGWITGKIMKGSGFGFWLDMLIGIAGAFVGGFIAEHIGLAASGGIIYTLIIAVLGAILLVFIFRLITGKR